ncbi:MAG: LppX_LprAFG lipoprotein [Nocardioidaceae bacterium]
MRTARYLVAPVAAIALLAGCTGDDDKEPETDPADRLAAAKETLDAADSIDLTLDTEQLPDGVDGVLSAEGTGSHAPAFEGSIEVSASGFAGRAEVVAVDGKVWAQLPFTSEFVVIDAESYGAPDPAALISSDGGLSSLLTSATEVEEAGERRDGETVVTEFTGTVDGATMSELFPTADPSGSFDVTFTLDDGDQVDTATIAGPFYEGAADVTYDVTLDVSDEPVEITAPQ